MPNIGTEIQLFLDDFAIERMSGLRRQVHQPVPYVVSRDGHELCRCLLPCAPGHRPRFSRPLL
jgi:hypothetical protein